MCTCSLLHLLRVNGALQLTFMRYSSIVMRSQGLEHPARIQRPSMRCAGKRIFRLCMGLLVAQTVLGRGGVMLLG